MRTQPIVIPCGSQAFEDGWNTLASREPIGWPTKDAPREDTIVQFMQTAYRVLNSLDWPTYETHWVAGLFAAWLLRK